MDPFKALRPGAGLASRPAERGAGCPYLTPSHGEQRDAVETRFLAQVVPLPPVFAPVLAAPQPPKSRRDSADEDFEPNELLLTYLKILQKSEDYNRRSVLRSEVQALGRIHCLWTDFSRVVGAFMNELRAVVDEENDARRCSEEEEDRTRRKLHAQQEQSHRMAKRHEDIRPDCPVLTSRKKVHVDPSLVDGSYLELRWRGGIFATLVALAFDDNNSLIGTATAAEVLRGHQASVAVRHVQPLPGPISVGCSTFTFSVILGNVPVRAKKLTFAVFNASSYGATLQDLSRAWLTLREPPVLDPATGTMVSRGCYTCGMECGGPNTAIVFASLARHHNDATAWQFIVHLEPYIWAPTPQRLSVLVAARSVDAAVGLEEEVTAAYERLGTVLFTFWADVSHKLVVLEEGEAWLSVVADARYDRQQVAAIRERRRPTRTRMPNGYEP